MNFSTIMNFMKLLSKNIKFLSKRYGEIFGMCGEQILGKTWV